MKNSIYCVVPKKQAKSRAAVTQPSDQSVRYISLTRNQIAVVDADLYDWLMQWNWQAHWSPSSRSFYAVRNMKTGDRTTRIPMHRQVLGLEPGDPRVGDHIDCSGTLNNTRSNLRIATPTENSRNRRAFANHSTGIKGVIRQGGRWKARIRVSGKLMTLGCFTTPELAHQAYCTAARHHFGEYARTS